MQFKIAKCLKHGKSSNPEVTEMCNTGIKRKFIGFLMIFLKIAKNYSMKRNLHISGKWQNQQINQFLGIGKF